MTGSDLSTLRFGNFAIDTRRRHLTRDGEDIALSPHLVDILMHLASRPGELVTKDALLEQFWPDVHVSENTLTRAIADIRKALGDEAGEPEFIQTVARRGYRFIAIPTADATAGRQSADSSRESAAGTDPFREWVRGRLSLEALDAAKLPEAVAAFEHAVAATPAYAPAHAGLANACFLQFERTRAHNIPNRALLMRAITHARRACELDQRLGEAWATLGFVLTAAGEVEEARAAARHAAALEPTSWRHHFRLAIASWGEERLRAVDRTLSLLPGFAPARFLAAMVFIARQALEPALEAVTLGAAVQAREAESGTSLLFPAVGLRWLHGLLLLHSGRVGDAVMEFVHEIENAGRGRVYGEEFRVNAQVAAGFAHLSIDDAAGAADAFRAALETVPGNGRALVGLYLALMRTSFAPEAGQLLVQIDRSIAELSSGQRLTEAAVILAASQAARGNVDAALATLHRLLDAAPPGQTGWLIPIDPALSALRATSGFAALTAKLASRAA